jgi:hypothetical protein
MQHLVDEHTNGRDSSRFLEEIVSHAVSHCPRRFLRAGSLIATLSLAGVLSAAALADDGSGALLGQSGSNGRGQSGSNGRAITIADVLGQSGSNGRGQSGSNGRGALKSAAMGIIEKVGLSGQTNVVVVLGQVFPVDASSAAVVTLGDYVLVTVDTADATVLQKIGEPYVAGVSPVALMGVVAKVDARTASLVVGGASVDYSSQLTLNPGLLPAPGGVFEAVGTQPVPGGVVLAGLQYDGAVVTLSSQD